MSQLPLPIAWTGRGEGNQLLIHGANTQAVAFLRDRSLWPSHCSLLVGPHRSGRSIIGRMIAAETGTMVIDDADQADEQVLFNAWNETLDRAGTLLLIAQEAPPVWQIALPDLRTRLATAAVVRIDPPDEAVSAALIVHGLELAGSAFAPDVPEYLARRTPRCYEAIERAVACLNAESVATGQKISVASAQQMLCNDPDLDELTNQISREGHDKRG